MEKKRKNTRRNRGITLIALVITVIILLILAGISIAELTGTGIFAKAKEAKQKYKDAEDLENKMLADYESQLNTLGKSTVGSGDGGDGNHQGDSPTTSQVVSASDIASAEDKSEVYGKEVTNYTVDGVDVKWDIFYSDKNNIYLIANDYIERDKLPSTKNENTPNGGDTSGRRANFTNVIKDYSGSSDITDPKIKALNNDYFNNHSYTSTNKNMKAVAYMLDTEIWKKFAQNDVTDYVIGGPTIELLFKSYNDMNKTKWVAEATSEIGYKIGEETSDERYNNLTGVLKTENLYKIKDTTNANGMWLASPPNENSDNVMAATYDGRIENRYYDVDMFGFRPIVCLKSDIQLQKSDDGNYTIVNQQ